MPDYMNDTNAVLQNLKDAGCDDEVVKTFMELAETGEKQKQYRLLEKHRRDLLEKVHNRERQIDCLDYLVFQSQRTNESSKKNFYQ